MTQATPQPRRSRPPGRIHEAIVSGQPVLCLSGDIEATTVYAFTRTCPKPCEYSTVDVHGATFLDWEAVAFLLRVTNSARRTGALPRLLGATGQVARILQRTEALSQFDIADTA